MSTPSPNPQTTLEVQKLSIERLLGARLELRLSIERLTSVDITHLSRTQQEEYSQVLQEGRAAVRVLDQEIARREIRHVRAQAQRFSVGTSETTVSPRAREETP